MFVRKMEIELVVPFHDVDFMGVVWHGRYLKYFEIAREELMRAIGYATSDMIASGYVWPVVDLRVKYVRPLNLNQRVCVMAELVEWEHRMKIEYAVYDAASRELLTKAVTTQVALDMNTREMCFETPLEFREKVSGWQT